jgi:hypothetical protein
MSVQKVTAEDKKHEGDVTCIFYHEGTLFSSGADGKIKVISLQWQFTHF